MSDSDGWALPDDIRARAYEAATPLGYSIGAESAEYIEPWECWGAIRAALKRVNATSPDVRALSPPEGLDGQTGNLRSALDSGDPHRLLAAVGLELRSVAQFHVRGFGEDTVSVRKAFLRHLAECIGAANATSPDVRPSVSPEGITILNDAPPRDR